MSFVATAGVSRPYTAIIAKALKGLFIKNKAFIRRGKKYYSQHDSRVFIVVTIFNFMILIVMSRFNVYVPVNIKLCGSCDSLSSPKKD